MLERNSPTEIAVRQTEDFVLLERLSVSGDMFLLVAECRLLSSANWPSYELVVDENPSVRVEQRDSETRTRERRKDKSERSVNSSLERPGRHSAE
ncbi:hypothetical protein MKX08_003697 [Trichoderma sp. CBMAI-0020]|nr:hypothetical protein MKX08_003697 [Trichoderma sp. CBMAI-0020]WOD46197.1 hypothetical protein [Trichoderma atroviride]